MRVVLDYIFDWLPFGLGVSIFISAGFTLLADEFKKYTAARICFFLATAWVFGKVVMWSYFTDERFMVRAVICGLVFGLVGIGLNESLRLTRQRESRPSKASEPPGGTETVPEQKSEEWKRGAKVEWGPVRDISPPSRNTPFFINFYSPNTGQLDALNVRRSYSWRLTTKENQSLSAEDVDKGFSIAKAGLMYPTSDEVFDRIPTGDSKTWFTANNPFIKKREFNDILGCI